MAMPLTIIGSQFYATYTQHDQKRKRYNARAMFRRAAAKVTEDLEIFKSLKQAAASEPSPLEQLCQKSQLQEDHAKTITAYVCLTREQIHSHKTLEQIANLESMHRQVMDITALYLHAESEKEMLHQHLTAAKSIQKYR